MATGTVKWFSDVKGYGFIINDEGGPDVFVHHTGVVGSGRRSLQEGARVRFETREGRKGLEAFDVKPMPSMESRTSSEKHSVRAGRRLTLPGRRVSR